MEQQSIPQDLFATGINAGSPAGSKVGAGRYCLTKILGRGGMGIVWLAHDERLGSEVALKFLPPQIRYDSMALDDLRRETARSRKLTHPNIVRIHDLYEAEGEDAFISMEYIDGSNLADMRVGESARVFTWPFLKPLVEQLCAGLDYAHSERIIHRDLKPANLMLDKKGRLKLADFGIARAVSDTMSRNSLSQTSGTLLYMSPQQMEGEIPRATDDIYALGSTLYELLTGKPPFYTGNIMHQVRNISPRPMQERLEELEFTNDIPREVEQVVMACLSKNPSHRPQSAAEVARLIKGERLKLADTKARLEIRQESESEASQPKAWWWTAAAAIALGAGIWAVGYSAKGTAKSRAAGQTRSAQSVPLATPSKNPGATSAPSRTLSPATAKPAATVASVPSSAASQGAFARISQPVTNVPIKAPSAPAQESRLAVTPAPTPPPLPVSQAPAEIKPAVVAKIEPPVPTQRSETLAPDRTQALAASPATTSETNTSAPVILSKATGLELLEKGNSHVSARSKNRVLEMVSGRVPVGETPQIWRIRYYDDKTTYKAVEVRFEGGEMVRVYEPTRVFELFHFGSQKTLDLAKVRIDSDQAIRIAAAECPAEEATPKSVEVKLERGYGGLPVWNVKLFGTIAGKASDEAGLGSVIVLAEDGKVLKKDITTKSEKIVSKK